jgi:pimeloyl-ACP methyl ester carboxylesterase
LADWHAGWGVACAVGAVTELAWRHKPSWNLVATKDRMPPAAQRATATRARRRHREAVGGHAIHVSQPRAVADIVRQAASAFAMGETLAPLRQQGGVTTLAALRSIWR